MPATYLDEFRPRTLVHQAAGEPRIDGLRVPMTQRSSGTSTRRAAELVKHYQYWNYIGLSRMAEFCAGQFPLAGTPTTGGPARFLKASQRAFLQSTYGWLRQGAQDDVEPLAETHPFLQLLQQPNEEDTWCEFAFEAFMMQYLTGELYLWAIPNGFRVPSRLWVVPTQWVVRRYSKSGQLIAYEFVPDGDRSRMETVPPEEVVQGRLKNPRSKIDGMAPIEAAPLWTDSVEWIEASRGQSMKNGSNPDLIVKLGDRYKDPSDDLLTRLKEKFRMRVAGLAHHGEPLMVPPGMDVERWSLSPREMDYPASSDQARNNGLALHGVPPVVAGISSDYTRATADAAHAVFCQVTANPKLRRWAGVLTKVGRLFDPRIVAWFEDCTPADQEFALKQEQADFEMGAIDPDEVRALRNREPKGEPAYETGYIGGGRLPLSEDAQPEPLLEATDPAPPVGEEEPDEPTDDEAEDDDEA